MIVPHLIDPASCDASTAYTNTEQTGILRLHGFQFTFPSESRGYILYLDCTNQVSVVYFWNLPDVDSILMEVQHRK